MPHPEPVIPPSPETAEKAIGPSEIADLFRAHNQLLVRFLRARLGSEHEAREVAQETYVRLLELDRTQTVSFMRAYLFKIAANLAIDRIRQRSTKAGGPHEDIDLFEGLVDDRPTPERMAMATEELKLLSGYLDELPARCARAFALHRFEDLSHGRIAEIVGVSDRMVRRYILRTMLYCKLRLEGYSVFRARLESMR